MQVEGNVHSGPSKDEHVGNEAAIGIKGDVHSMPSKAGNSAKGLGPAKTNFERKARADVANEGPFCDQAIFNNRYDTVDNVANPSTQ